MPEFQLLRCMVALGGDDNTTVYRHRGNPILFPELIVLQALHGEEAITDVHVVGVCDMTQDEALLRLRMIYGETIIKEQFPGARVRLPTGDASVPICTLPVYVPKPTRPDSPDPKLRPLDGYTITEHMPRVEATPPSPEDDPTPEEIAAHSQDDDDLDAMLDLPEDTAPSRPTVADMVQKRVSYRGNNASQARRTPDHLPDVAHTPRVKHQRDHSRPRG